jgi:hypothetical protein
VHVRHTLTFYRHIALLGPSSTQGSVESASSIASEQYAKALAAASSVLYGTEQPAVESATSVAAQKYDQAVTAASYAIYGTPTPTAVIKTVQIQVRTLCISQPYSYQLAWDGLQITLSFFLSVY